MGGRVVAALRGWLVAKRDDLASLLWIAANLRQVGHCLQLLFDTRFHGGSMVCVPPQAPLICTLVQLDGDFVTFVDPRTFTEARSPEALSALIAQHAEALRTHLPAPDPAFGAHVAGCVRALRDVALAGWVALEALGAVTLQASWHALTGDLNALSMAALRAAWPALQPVLLWQAVAIGIPALLHFGAPRLLRALLRRGRLH